MQGMYDFWSIITIGRVGRAYVAGLRLSSHSSISRLCNAYVWAAKAAKIQLWLTNQSSREINQPVHTSNQPTGAINQPT